MSKSILIPKDTPDWQEILSDVESARNSAISAKDSTISAKDTAVSAKDSAISARDSVDDSISDIESLGGIDGTVRSVSDLPSSTGDNSFYYVVEESSYYQDTGSGSIQSGWDKIEPGWSNASNLKSGTLNDEQFQESNRYTLTQSKDIQNLLDKDSKRSVLIRATERKYQRSTKVLLGSNSKIEGVSADMVDLGGQEYRPIPVFEFTSDVHGFQADPNANYRVHKPHLEDVTIVGTGSANGKTAVDLPTNSNDDTVGAFLEGVYLEQFENLINAFGKSSVRASYCHFRKCKRGITGLRHGWIDSCVWWDFREPGGFCIEADHNTRITNGRFEPGSNMGDLDHIRVVGNAVKIIGNYGKYAHNNSIVVNGANARSSTQIIGNRWEGSVERWLKTINDGQVVAIGNVIDVDYNISAAILEEGCIFSNNDLTGSNDINGTQPEVLLKGGNCRLIGNVFSNKADKSVKIQSGANSNILKGVFPNKVVINGDSNEAEGEFREKVTVSGKNNSIRGQIKGDINITGNENLIEGNVRGNVAISGDNNIFRGSFANGVGATNTTNTRVYDPNLEWSDINVGTRTTLNDVGRNSGDPRSTGQWNGNGYSGLVVEDVSNNDYYKYITGTWRQIGSAGFSY